MMHHDTKYNPLSLHSCQQIPTASMQIAHVDCFHCGQVTRFPVPAEYVDWKIISEEYRTQLEKMMNRFNKIVNDIDVMQLGDNPVREYLVNEWKMLELEIKRKFEK